MTYNVFGETLSLTQSICGTWQMRGSALSLQNGGVSGGGRSAGGPRARKHTSVSVDTLDDVCFKSDSAFRSL